MWAARVLIPFDKSQVVAPLTKKYGVTVHGYPVSHYIRKNKLGVIAAGTVIGRNVEQFIFDLKKNKCVKNVEYDNGYFILEFLQDIAMKVLYEPGLIHSKPVVITPSGENYFEICAWEKEMLLPFISLVRKYNGKLFWVRQTKPSSLLITNVLPFMTERQKEALQLAVKNGYYEYPRQIDLMKLAKIMKVSYSTFQFHLRRAENKIMNIRV